MVCAAIFGRPVAPKLDAIATIGELTRVASDRTPHAASMCIAAATRAALALGYRRIISYTIYGESGASYLAAGWRITGLTGGFDGWNSRPGRSTATQTTIKVRWETGPDALEWDGPAAMLFGFAIGRVEVPAREESLPLLAAMEASAANGRSDAA